jgi:hypothetical protein
MEQLANAPRLARRMSRDRSYGLCNIYVVEPIQHNKEPIIQNAIPNTNPKQNREDFETELNSKIEDIWNRLANLKDGYSKKFVCEQLKFSLNDFTKYLNTFLHTLDVNTIKTFHKLIRITSDAINRAQVGLPPVNKPKFGPRGVKFDDNETVFEEDEKTSSVENHEEDIEEKERQEELRRQELERKRERRRRKEAKRREQQRLREEELKRQQEALQEEKRKEKQRLIEERKKQQELKRLEEKRKAEEMEFLEQERRIHRELEEENKKEEALKYKIKKREVVERRKQLEMKIEQLYAVQPPFNGIQNLEKVKVIKKDVDLQSASCFQLRDLIECEIILAGSCKSIDLFRLKGCKIYIGPVSGSANISDCENCTISVASYQLRIIDSTHCNFYVHCTTNPIIDNVSHLMLAPYNFSYDELPQHMQSSNLVGENKWENVRDFQCLKKGKSSNWEVIPESERTSYYYTEYNNNLQAHLNDSLENPLDILEDNVTSHQEDERESIVSAPIMIQKRVIKSQNQKRTPSVKSEAESGYQPAALPRRASQRNGAQTNYQMIAQAKKVSSVRSFSTDQKKEVHKIGAVYNEVAARSGRYSSQNPPPSYKLKLPKERQPISFRKPPKPATYIQGIIHVNPKADLKQLFDESDMPKWAAK